jgi:myo-inositol 2-dehydrogenase / D-chiro-inositol 1-dehydrogenase
MPVGVAVAGLGEIGRLHARNLAGSVPHARLLWVVDQVADLARELGAELQAAWSTSYRDALADPAVEAVVIATPTPLHAEMVVGAAQAGMHVFCEKPLSIDEQGGRAAAAAMEQARRRLQVGFQRRFDPDWMAAKKCIDAGELGAVRLLRISHRNRAHPHGGGSERLGSLFVDMSVHDMDSARWLVGEVAEVSAFADGDTAVTVLRFESGALGVIDNTRTAGYGFDCTAEVMGTDSTLRIGTVSRAADIERLTEDGLLVPLPADHIERHRAAYLDEMREFVRCLEDGEPTAVGGVDAVAALALALAAERSCAPR